jgi:hypothetical protein
MIGIAMQRSMRPSRIFSLLAFLFLPYIAESQIVINEIMAANANMVIEADYYNFPDWLEIYNNGTSMINLSEYFLSDNKDELKKWQFPSVPLNTGQYYVVYCDKKGTGRHATFGLSADGETIYLSDNSGIIIDQVKFGKQFSDVAYGRDPSNPDQWFFCSVPTPGGLNSITTATIQSPGAGYSIPAGRLNSAGMLTLTGNGIKYTTSGAEPETISPSYSQPLDINYTMVVKTKTFQDGYLPGETYASTFFLNEHEFTLPVVSISFTPAYFYDNTIGIHVLGTNGIAGPCGNVANWNQNWERAAYLEYFDEKGIKQISQPIGVKLAGGCTRGRDQKSLSIYARSKYGDNDFDFPFFKEKPEVNRFKSLLLRNSGNDQDQTLLRDAFLQSLVKKSMDLDFQSYQPAIVYFNDQYRGIMNLREKVDEDYFFSNYAIGSDEIDFLEGILRSDFDNCYNAIRGSQSDYREIISYISANDLTDDENYRLISSRLDIQEYINYMTLEIYVGNRDWPGNNLKFWKKSINGKWRWIVFDLDYGFGFRLDNNGYTHQTFHFATEANGPEHPNPPWSTLLFRKLLENDGFRKQFLSTYITHMYSSFSPEWCNYVLDSLSAAINQEMVFNQLKFGRTMDQWFQYLNTLKQYAVNRSNFMPGYVESFFNLSSEKVTVMVSNPDIGKGRVNINHALVQMYPVNITTYKELPLLLIAVPEKGYKFAQWNYSGTAEKYSDNIELYSDTGYNVAIEPAFEPIDEIDGIYLNEIASTTGLFRDEYNEKSGYVELHNNTNEDVALFSYFLSDNAANLIRYAIPDSTVIPANGFITFYLDGDTKQGPLHASFKADPDGESMYLSQKVGGTVYIHDSVSFRFLVEDHSLGKYEDGTGAWQYMVKLTPGQPNDPDRLNYQQEMNELTHDIMIYPNPCIGNITISFNTDDLFSQVYSMDVIDISGKVVYPEVWLNSSISQVSLNLINQGLYFVRIFKNRHLIHTDKLIILK